MSFQQHVQLLRAQLLCMSRLSQRALDYSIKGYELGSLDFCRHVRSVEHKLGEHHRQIKYLCRQVTTSRSSASCDIRFALAASRIDTALNKTYGTAVQMAQNTILFLKAGSLNKCIALNRFGRLVNSLMRLCIVALFERESNYAETVIHSQELWRRCELIFDRPLSDVDQETETMESYVLITAQVLGVVAKQAHEMADAILFWLSDCESSFTSDEEGEDILNLLFLGNGSCREGRYEYEPDSFSRALRSDFRFRNNHLLTALRVIPRSL